MKTKAMLALPAVAIGLAAITPPAAANPYPDENVQWFRSPSGNIHCEMSFQRTAPAAYGEDFLPDYAYCMSGTPLQSVSIRSDGSLKRVCTDDVSCGSNAPLDEGVLPYGQSAVLGPFTCLSEESGMTCTANGRGFRISSAGIVPV